MEFTDIITLVLLAYMFIRCWRAHMWGITRRARIRTYLAKTPAYQIPLHVNVAALQDEYATCGWLSYVVTPVFLLSIIGFASFTLFY